MFRTHFTHNFSFHKTTTYSQQLEQPVRWSYHRTESPILIMFILQFRSRCVFYMHFHWLELWVKARQNGREKKKAGACFNYQQTQLMANMEQNRKTCPTVKNIGKNHIRTYDSNYPAIVSYFNRWSNAFCLSHRKH